MTAGPKNLQIITKTIPEKKIFLIRLILDDGCFSKSFWQFAGQPFPGELLVEASESKITELFIYFFVCRGQWYDIFLTKDCVALLVFLENCESERKST